MADGILASRRPAAAAQAAALRTAASYLWSSEKQLDQSIAAAYCAGHRNRPTLETE
jgi:hypothetical protein